MEFIKGPLGSHRNYLNHIALMNCIDYFNLQKKHEEMNESNTPSKYEELRLFLNAIESLNNILDYFYYENEDSISHSKLNDFKRAVFGQYPALNDVADIANAYKHCIREGRSGKNAKLPWAKDLQKPSLVVDINISDTSQPKVEAEFKFEWPISEHEEAISEAFRFWIKYQNDEGPNLLSV
jgi:hypothetical protein